MQSASAVDATLRVVLPTGHSVYAIDPGAPAHVPTGALVHASVAVSGAYSPGRHGVQP